MAEYDGSIKINTEIDTKNASSQMLSLENKISKTASKIEGLKTKMEKLKTVKVPTAEYKEIQTQIEKATANIDKLINKQQAMASSGQQGSKAFEKIDAQIEELHQELKYANQELDDLVASGEAFKIGADPTEIQKVTDELRQAENEMTILNAKYDEFGDKSFDKTARKIENVFSRASGQIGQTGIKLGSVISEMSVGLAAATGGISIAIGLAIKGLTTLFDLAKKVTTAIGNSLKNAFSKLKDVAVSSLEAIISTAQSLGSKIASVVGGIVSSISSMAVSLANSVLNLSGISASLDNALSKITYVNQEYAQMQTLLATIKAQTGSAFAPLVSVAIPYIKQALSWVLKLVNAFSQLMALLSGKKTWSKAVVNTSSGSGSSASSKKKTAEEKQLEAQKKAEEKASKQAAKVEERNAKALEKQAKAYQEAEESARHYLSPLDEINKYTEKKDVGELELETFDPSEYLTDIDEVADDVVGGAEDGISYIEEAIDNDIKDLFDWLKEMWDKGDFTDLGKKIAKWLQDALESIPWDKIKATARKLGKSLATLLNGIFGNKELAYDIGKTFAETINTIFEFAYGFLSNFDSREFASFLTEAIKGAFENIDWDLIKNTFNEFATKLADWIDEFVNTFPWDELADFVVNAINTVLDSLSNFINTMDTNSTFGNLGEKIGTTIRSIFEGIDWETAKDILVNGFKGAWDFFVGFVKGLVGSKTLSETISKAFDFADSCIDVLGKAINTIAKKLYELLTKMTETDPTTGKSPAELLGSRMGESIGKLVDQIDPQVWSDLLNGLIKLFGQVISSIWDELQANGTFDEFRDKLGEIFSNIDFTPILEAVKPMLLELGKGMLKSVADGIKFTIELESKLSNLGEMIAEGILKGFIKDLDPKTQEAITELFRVVYNTICGIFGIHSPATEMYPLGGFILEGLIEGFKEKFEEWTEAINTFFEEYIKPWFSAETWTEILTPFKEQLGNTLDEIKTNWEEKWTNIKDKAKEIWDEIKTYIEEKIKNIKEELDKVNQWKADWDSAWDGFKDKVTGVWDDIKQAVSDAVDFIKGLVADVLSAIDSVKSAASNLSFGGIAKGIGTFISGKSTSGRGYANGTVIPASHGEFMARVGDNNRETEVISPLSVIKQALHEELSGLSLGGGDVTIRQYLDGTQIAESVVRAGRLEQNATGTNIFALG